MLMQLQLQRRSGVWRGVKGRCRAHSMATMQTARPRPARLSRQADRCRNVPRPAVFKWPNRDPINELGHRLLRSDRSKGSVPYRAEELNLFAFLHNDPIDALDPLGLGDFTNAECIAACEAVSAGKNKLYQACVAVCKSLKGKTCNQLWSYCMQLDRHPCGQAGKMCRLVYLELCSGT